MRYQQFIPLKPATCDRNSVTSIGTELAAAHAKLQGYPNACKLKPDLYGFDAQDGEPAQNGSFNRLQASKIARRFRRSQMSAFEAIDSRVKDHLARTRLPANLTISVIHGDIYLDNILLHPGGRAFLLDWEAIQAPIAIDLAVLSADLYLAQDVSFERWETLCGWLMSAYTKRMKLADEDLLSIPIYILRTLLNLVRIYTTPSADFRRKAEVIKRCYQLADFLLREEQRLQDKAWPS
jgi:Ser/Thr protein kinase RdoA (MazF antagonist)